MSDRELLELAAKAAGLDYEWNACSNCGIQYIPKGFKHYVDWSPLTDDGDRHRLLIDLKMTLAHEPSRGGWSVGAVVAGEFRWLAFDEDEARAIVRAAAEIGRAMP